MRLCRLVVGLAVLLCGACKTTPVDRFQAGEAAVLKNDLLTALQAFDEVPVSHPRYPEARAAAAGVERRMRRSHEILLEGLMLRSEWRDREALAALQRAREVWVGLPGVDVLIRATEHRLGLFTVPEEGAAVVAVAAPSPSPSVEPPPAVPMVEVPVQKAPEEPSLGAEVGNPSSAAPEVAPAVPVELPAPLADAVAAGLVAVEGRLSRGEFEGAVADLFDLAKYHPEDLRVRLRLARVLHQRALLRYGQGALTGAISDWERVLQLEPGHAVARNLLLSARAEATGGGGGR
ncbi:MAG: hypothetical protein IT456_24850 [Planctomycetes bacterium]|nr:hypothetical protein [Planctomycetota bacterium]